MIFGFDGDREEFEKALYNLIQGHRLGTKSDII